MSSSYFSGEVREIEAGVPVSGRISPPGSKSLTQRYLNLCLISRSGTVLERPLLSEDTEQFIAALEVCGFGISRRPQRVVLQPVERHPRRAEIYCGNGGTMFRFLTASLTGVHGNWGLDGVSRLRERPIGPLVDSLRQLGATIESDGFAPLRVHGDRLKGGRATIDAGASSQFLSALLMAALRAETDTTIDVGGTVASAPYVELTLAAIELFGGRVRSRADGTYSVPGRQQLAAPASIRVEADFSAAAYPAAAAAITGGAVRIDNLSADSAQGDRGFMQLLAQMGASIEWHEGWVRVRGRGLRAVDVDLSTMPDQVPTLAVIAPFAEGTTVIRNVAHLRIKESDRLRAMRIELERVGVPVEELDDGLRIEGCWVRDPPPSRRVEVDSHGDHRIAMSMALLGLRRPGVVVRDPGVVAKSYPVFWDDLGSLLVSR